MVAAVGWTIRNRRLTFSGFPLLMGILNITPDSFSDGGQFFTVQAAIDQARRLEDQGADILDVGGKSTRPYSLPVPEAEELRRVTDFLSALGDKLSVPISIDTTKASVAQAAMELGASIINDVSGLEADPEMVEVARRTEAGVCAMHRQGTPQTMQDDPAYENVVQEILDYLKDRDHWLLSQGISPDRICLDPGIGFGKTHQHNITLLRHASRFHELGRPILVGHSRKGFIAKILGSKDVSRTFGTVGVSLALALQKIQILRVHDVAEHKQALNLFQETCPLFDGHR
jgi:dihydropteroate synthase